MLMNKSLRHVVEFYALNEFVEMCSPPSECSCLFPFCCSRVLRVLIPLTPRLPRGCSHPWMIRRSLVFFETVFAVLRRSCLGCVVTPMFGSPRQIVVQPERST